jgi:hypothetical protein
MKALNLHLSHLVGDGVVSLSRKPVDTGPQKEMSTVHHGQRKQFVDIALAISDADYAIRFGQQRRGLLQGDSFLSAQSGTRVGLILRLSAFAPWNLSLGQNLMEACPRGRHPASPPR